MCKISVIIPAHNIENYLKFCLDSLSAQSFKDFEVLIMENGSSDGTYSEALKYAEKDGRFKVFKLEGKGVSNARNEGIRKSEGGFIVFIDGDDFVPDNYLDVLYNNILSSDDTDMVIVPHIRYYNDGKKTAASVFPPCRLEGSDKKRVFLIGAAWSKIYRKEMLRLNDIYFDIRYHNGEDMLFSAEALLASRAVAVSDETYYCYRQGRSGQVSSAKKNFENVESFFKVLLDIRELLHKYSVYEEYKAMIDFKIAGALIGESFAASSFRKLSRKDADKIILPVKEMLLNMELNPEICKPWQIRWFNYFKFWLKRDKYHGFIKFMRFYRNAILQPLGIKIH